MNVVHLIGHLDLGGIEVFVPQLVKYQKKVDINVELWCLEDAKDKKFQLKVVKELGELGINVVIFTQTTDRLLRVKEIIKNIKRFKPSVINSHGLHLSFYAFLGKMFSRQFKINIIESLHSTYFDYKFIQFLISNFIVEKNIAITPKVKKLMISDIKIKSKKITVITNGISLPEKDFFLRKNVKEVISIGRLIASKGYDVLLKAYKNMNEKGIELPLLKIYGDGPLRSDLEKYIKENNLTERVELRGTVTNIYDEIYISDLYITASEFEGLSIALLECMGVGVPVLSSKVPGLEDVLKQTEACFFDRENILNFEKEFLNLINDFELRKKNSESMLLESKKYCIKKTADEYNKLYRQVINSNKKNTLDE